jgi:hypothetical protein
MSASPTAASRVLVVAAFAGLFGCSGSGGATPAAQVPGLEVETISPVSGAELQDPRTAVLVTFREPVGHVAPEQFVVDDGAGPLPGSIEGSVDGRTWHWQPFRDLPRGGRITVRIAAGLTAGSGARLAADHVASFTVREPQVSAEHPLGPAAAGKLAALAWPVGFRAVANGSTLYTLDATGPIAWPVPTTGQTVAWAADATGGFAALVHDTAGPTLQLVRGSLGTGMVTTTLGSPAGAFGRVELAASARGDLGAYFYGIEPTQGRDVLWASTSGAAAWRALPLPALGPFPLRRIAIDGAGNVFVACWDAGAGQLFVERHEAATGGVQRHAVCPLPDSFAFGAQANGDARFVWRQSVVVGGVEQRIRWSRRFRAGAGFDAPVEVHRGAAWADHSAIAADGGAFVAIAREPIGAATERLQVQRLEADGRIGVPTTIYEGAPLAVHTLAVAPRGEAWFLFVGADAAGNDRIVRVRCRPGALPDAAEAVYTSPAPSYRLNRLAAALDDSGRAVVAFTAAGPTGQVLVHALTLD